MSSAFILLCLLLGVHAGFQDGIVPRAALTAALPAACGTVDFALSYCSSVSPGFLTMALTDQAPCLCYSSTSWIPDAFDGAVETCAEYAATALPASEYSDLAGLEGFCSAIGDVENSGSPATVSATTTPAAKVTPAPSSGSVDIFTNTACSLVGFALSYCNSVSPGFTSMDPTSQAPCLCYSSVNPTSTAWLPDIFDGSVLTCAEFVSSVAPESLSIVTGLEHFCTDVGNVLGGSSAGATKTGGGVASTKQTTTSKPGVTVTIATPVATTIQQAPTTSTNSSAASGMRNEMWGLGLVAVGVSFFVLA